MVTPTEELSRLLTLLANTIADMDDESIVNATEVLRGHPQLKRLAELGAVIGKLSD